MIPWFHFVPAKPDYPDLFDIRAFFTGSPDGSVHGRGDLAERIAAQGYDFALERLRCDAISDNQLSTGDGSMSRDEDMRSYLFLLLFEVSPVGRWTSFCSFRLLRATVSPRMVR